MNLNQLKLFYLAVKRQSLTAAADELNITQPAVTKGIHRMQEYYEVQLVHRIGKQIELTEAGDALFKYAEKIFELEGLAEDCIRAFQPTGLQHLHILSSETFGAYYLPPLIGRFNRTHARIRVTLDIVSNRQVVEKTAALMCDMGFVSEKVSHRKLIVHDILEEEPVLIVSHGHPLGKKADIHPEDLQGEVMVMHEEGSVFQKVIRKMIDEKRVELSTPVSLSNNEAIKRAVEGGAGIAVISKKVAEEEIRSGRLKGIPLSGMIGRRKFYLLCHKEKHLSGAMKNFIGMLKDWATEKEGQGAGGAVEH